MKNFARVMGLLFGSAGAHTYPKSGQVAPSPPRSKQRSFEDFIGTSFVLVDADLLLIWMNNFQLCFRFHLASCPVLPAVLIIS